MYALLCSSLKAMWPLRRVLERADLPEPLPSHFLWGYGKASTGRATARLSWHRRASNVTVATPFIPGSAVVTSWLAFNHDVRATMAVTVGALAGLVMYASAFVWLGLVTRQAIGVGLLYIVLWEGFFSGYVSGIRFLSIRHYSVALMHGLDPRRFVGEPHVGLTAATVGTVVVCVGFLALSTRRLRRMDVP